MGKQVTLCVVGAGDRGRTYSGYAAQYPAQAQVVAVAEPRAFYRSDLAAKHNIPVDNVFQTWQHLAACDRKVADAVIITTQDTMHTAPALALINKGYDVLLEKPMAPGRDECEQIVKAAIEKDIIFAVCHVLRYTSYTQQLKSLIDSGFIGDLISIQHLEPIGYDHFAHSFVRGNWRNENDSGFMLMTKACHDLDWLRYIVGSKVTRVASFGSLKHFMADHKPVGAGERCTGCEIEPDCPYSAVKIYLNRIRSGHSHWPVDTITSDVTVTGVQKAIETGPYGRCVYQCDNDVADHQVVSMEFENGVSGVFTATAFTEMAARKTRIFGTRGELYGDGHTIDHYDFLRNGRETIEIAPIENPQANGHGGGDYGLMQNFIEAVSQRDQDIILSGPIESMESYLSVFAAEQARKNGCVIEL